MVNYLSVISSELGIPIWFFIVIFFWSTVWKLFALWKSARKGSVVWFVIFALINTAGILEILYIFVFSKMKTKKNVKEKKISSKRKKRRGFLN